MLAARVLAVHPPCEIQQQLLEAALEKERVALPASAADFVNAPAGPRVDGRVHVGEIPLVRGQRAVGPQIPFAKQKEELTLGKIRIDAAHWDHVKGEIPRCVPRVFPLVGHRDDVRVVEVRPVGVARLRVMRGRARLVRIAGEPAAHVVVVKLLRPQQSRVGLVQDVALLLAEARRAFRAVKKMRVVAALGEDGVEIRERARREIERVAEAEAQHFRSAGRQIDHIVRRAFRAGLRGFTTPGVP
jgi:hypothetical protein